MRGQGHSRQREKLVENHKGTNQLGIFFIVWGAANSSSVEMRERIGGLRRAEVLKAKLRNLDVSPETDASQKFPLM